jgi:hypothetical protein
MVDPANTDNGGVTLPEITETDWRADLDKMRAASAFLTDDQYKMIKYARESPVPVTWDNCVIQWERCGWGVIPRQTLRDKYVRTQEKIRRDSASINDD